MEGVYVTPTKMIESKLAENQRTIDWAEERLEELGAQMRDATVALNAAKTTFQTYTDVLAALKEMARDTPASRTTNKPVTTDLNWQQLIEKTAKERMPTTFTTDELFDKLVSMGEDPNRSTITARLSGMKQVGTLEVDSLTPTGVSGRAVTNYRLPTPKSQFEKAMTPVRSNGRLPG